MKSRIALALTLAMSSSAFADVGIGVSIQSEDSRVYVPIDITESFRIEPLVRYYKNEESEGDSEYKTKYSEIGAGFFGKSGLTENLDFLYGVRVAYTKEKRVYQYANFDRDLDLELDGYAIAPTIGFEYFVMEKFSIGGEVALAYTKMDGEEDDSGDKIDVDDKTTETDTSLNVRFYF